MKRRELIAGSLALAAVHGCSSPPQPLAHVTSEQLLVRIRDNAKAGKLTALHFWATWCGPCVEEFPLIAQEWAGWIRSEPKLDFLVVSVDEVDLKDVRDSGSEKAKQIRDAKVQTFLKQFNSTFPIAVAEAEDPEDFADEIDSGWPSVLPTTILFGLDGTVAQRHLGELKPSRFRDKVRELLKQP